ncbi:hypothetical protein SAMN05660860_01661 [Geoalkalibacter ferrihydriticus]|uniref:TIGR02270 family protein n=2 Tax=Geoalkalibacter ferrihydriticus TaxID=392333 RepID=A0A0C2HUQ3_9BACT|nr:hypothetical protein [Geoalkalibacter ferrihydriticus]KIH76542.1 hypothetical protein GFER_10220 [Geoalkalibacter ferrihydriticus DSM 17813]SDM00536.1 hypothetical protein SAMN05660860_01661 [Geoalkalibacter ferrihydriticus]
MNQDSKITASVSSTYAQNHWDCAIALFRQRQSLLAASEMDAAVVARIEMTLRVHLHVLARSDWSEPHADKAAPVFVSLARRLSSPDPEMRQEGTARACSLLSDGGEMGKGAFVALTLLPPEDNARLLDLYRDHHGLRAQLFDLWREQGRRVPTGLLNRAELQGRDEALQEAALAYAASRPEIGVAVFHPYYRGLLSGSASPCSGRLTAQALWGALVRGEQDVAPALRRAVEQEAEPQTRFALLRLAALKADREVLPVLRRLLTERPAQGARLLALHGSLEAVDMLVEALFDPATMDAAARAWPWISAQALPHKARLQVVGAEGGQGLMPDGEVARAWWAQQRSALSPQDRLLFGAPLSRSRLQALALRKAGDAGRDLLDLLALSLQRPLGVSAHAEQAQRRACLYNLAESRER